MPWASALGWAVTLERNVRETSELTCVLLVHNGEIGSGSPGWHVVPEYTTAKSDSAFPTPLVQPSWQSTKRQQCASGHSGTLWYHYSHQYAAYTFAHLEFHLR